MDVYHILDLESLLTYLTRLILVRTENLELPHNLKASLHSTNIFQ